MHWFLIGIASQHFVLLIRILTELELVTAFVIDFWLQNFCNSLSWHSDYSISPHILHQFRFQMALHVVIQSLCPLIPSFLLQITGLSFFCTISTVTLIIVIPCIIIGNLGVGERVILELVINKILSNEYK